MWEFGAKRLSYTSGNKLGHKDREGILEATALLAKGAERFRRGE